MERARQRNQHSSRNRTRSGPGADTTAGIGIDTPVDQTLGAISAPGANQPGIFSGDLVQDEAVQQAKRNYRRGFPEENEKNENP